MKRNIIIFIATFVAGALVAFAARTALHQPHAVPSEHTVPEHGVMVNNALTPSPAAGNPAGGPAGRDMPSVPVTPTAQSNSGHHDHAAATAPAAEAVNTVCAICGMPVDPNIPMMEYQGKKVGFGCKMCPPKFKAEPDKYGPYYLRNEVIKR